MEPVQIESFVDEQLSRWKARQREKRPPAFLYPVITLSMEPGSGGRIIAGRTAQRLGYDYFDRDLIEGIAKSAKISAKVVDTLEKERLTGVEEFIASLVKIKYLYPGSYLRHLMRVVGAIAKHGRAVIVGRGANFLIPEDQRLSVRVIAPLDRRVENVAREFGLKLEAARKRVVQREAKRRAFIRESFHTSVDDPMHYDMVINTAKISLDSAVGAIVGALTPTPEASG